MRDLVAISMCVNLFHATRLSLANIREEAELIRTRRRSTGRCRVVDPGRGIFRMGISRDRLALAPW